MKICLNCHYWSKWTGGLCLLRNIPVGRLHSCSKFVPKGASVPLFHDSSFSSRKELNRRYILLDRDGVINEERKDYVKSPRELVIFEEALLGLRLLRENGFKAIVLTNQSVIGRGIIEEQDLRLIHQTLFEKVEKTGGSIERIYFCPHKPDDNCSCRKPKAGMFFRVSKDFNIDLKNTFYIGDKEIDVMAAKEAGCKAILIGKRNYQGSVKPDFMASNLYEAVRITLQHSVLSIQPSKQETKNPSLRS